MSEWEVKTDEYLDKLKISRANLEKSLGNLSSIHAIIPLRDLKTISAMVAIPKELVLRIIRRISTVDGQQPFAKSNIRVSKLDPTILRIGQRYAYREKVLSMVENVSQLFNNWLVSSCGLRTIGAYFIFGEDSKGRHCMACYLPPLVEQHNSHLIIMDGIHRNYLVGSMGSTQTAILIENVTVPFPCTAKEWGEILPLWVKDKPKNLADRYFDLKQDLFRDLKGMGIDG